MATADCQVSGWPCVASELMAIPMPWKDPYGAAVVSRSGTTER